MSVSQKRKFTSHYPSKGELQYLMDSYQFDAMEKRAKEMTPENMKLDILAKRKLQSLIIPFQIIKMIALYMDIKCIMVLSKSDSVFYEIITCDNFWEMKLYIDMPQFVPFKELILANLTAKKVYLLESPRANYYARIKTVTSVTKHGFGLIGWIRYKRSPALKFMRAYFVLVSLFDWIIEQHFSKVNGTDDYLFECIESSIFVTYRPLNLSTKISLEVYHQKFNCGKTIFENGMCLFWNNFVKKTKGATTIMRILFRRGYFKRKNRK